MPDPATNNGLLAGVTVVDLSTVGPAARTSRWLADYGARVIKVGAVPRQSGVQIVPPFYAYGGHRGMERLLLDLKSADGRGAFLRLAAQADVVIESFRPGVVDRLGIGYGDVALVNEAIIYCSTTGYGQTGPKAQWAGHDINYLAAGGFLDCSGRDTNGAPALPGATVADSAAGGMQAAMAIMAALVGRAATGVGSHLDVAVADGVVAIMSLYVDEYLATGQVPGPGHNILTGRYACYGVYRCADDKFVAVGAIEPKFFANLCAELGCPEWAEHQLNDELQEQIRVALAAAFATRTRAEWVTKLAPADTCVSAVATVPELVGDAHFGERSVFVEAQGPDGQFQQTGWLLAGQDRQQEAPVVREGSATDTSELLTELGYQPQQIDSLKAEGAVA